jgi:hypothetical protein
MPRFRVHFTRIDGARDSFVVDAKTPVDAGDYIKGRFTGAQIVKVKLDKLDLGKPGRHTQAGLKAKETGKQTAGGA